MANSVRVRDYINSNYGKYGVTNGDIGWRYDPDSKQNLIFVGGSQIGPSTSIETVDGGGVSYMDEDTLRSAMDKYVADRNLTDTTAKYVPQNQGKVDSLIADYEKPAQKYQSQYAPKIAELIDKYTNAEKYQSPYAASIKKYLDDFANMPAFSYDPNTDASFKAYSDMYARQGQSASERSMATLSAATGGRPSSYAAAAAAQAQQAYAKKATDVIPELSQQAYGRYRDSKGDLMTMANAYRGLDQDEYGRYRDDKGDMLNSIGLYQGEDNTAYDRFNTERTFDANKIKDLISLYQGQDDTNYNRFVDNRNFAYGANRDKLGDQRYDTEWKYNVGRDAISDARYADETAYSRGRDTIGDNRYKSEWDYKVGRDTIGDNRYDKEWDYNVGRDQIADNQFAAQLALKNGSDETDKEDQEVYDQNYGEALASFMVMDPEQVLSEIAADADHYNHWLSQIGTKNMMDLIKYLQEKTGEGSAILNRLLK